MKNNGLFPEDLDHNERTLVGGCHTQREYDRELQIMGKVYDYPEGYDKLSYETALSLLPVTRKENRVTKVVTRGLPKTAKQTIEGEASWRWR